MSHYLDTNALRQIHKISSGIHHELVVSFLGIFETISGIVSEREYEIRVPSLRRIIENKINIIWESPATLMSKCFSFGLPDFDVPATEKMLYEILRTDNFNEIKDISFEMGGNIYDIGTFIRYDRELSVETYDALNIAQSLPTREQRSALKTNGLTEALVRHESERTVMDFLIKRMGIPKHSDQYIKSINTFYSQQQLHNYVTGLTIKILTAMMLGQASGKNDGFDIAHLVYSDHMITFVSDDKIYQRLNQEFFSVEFITLNTFLDRYQQSPASIESAQSNCN